MSSGTALTSRPTRIRYVIFGLCCGTSWLLYLHRYVFGLIKPELIRTHGLTETDLGLLDTCFAVFYSVGQIPAGVAIDAFGVRGMLTGMIVLWCVGLGLHATARTFATLAFGRVILGIGQSGVYPALSRASRCWFPAASRTTAQGWIGVFSGRMGGVSASVLIGYLVLGKWNIPWQTAVSGLAVSGILFALVFAVVYCNSPSRHPGADAAEVALIQQGEAVDTSTRRLSFRELFQRMSGRSIRNLLSLNGQMLLSAAADDIFASWIPTFLSVVHHLQFQEMGIYWALPLVGGALGGATGGWLNDLLIRRTGNRRWSRTSVGAAGKGMAGVLLLFGLLWYDQPYTFCIILFFVKFFSDWSLATTWGAVTDIGGRETATVFAFNNAVGTLGAVIAPLIYGPIAQHAGWKTVFVTGAGIYFLCALSWLQFNSTIPVMGDEPAAPDGRG